MPHEYIGLLGHAILGLLRQNPASGYDLRKIFSETPMGNFSDSPGAIYPALRRLEAARLIQGKVEPASSPRQRKVFRLTRTGHAELEAWLFKPIQQEDVIHRMNELMLRFAFLAGVAGNEATTQFLHGLHVELKAYIGTLREFLQKYAASMPISGRLALESGVMGYEAQLHWAEHAIGIYDNLKCEAT